uniref:Uncharacterized protein n=1 Tax=Populus alba TaxID=43335 RepID=A0A4U5Q6M0_POPAL|nr:hypothetical protein D5086_0000128540 [Populus alba]
MIVTTILNFPPLPSISDLRTHLLAFEGQQALAAQMTHVASPAAFVIARFNRGPRHLWVVHLKFTFPLAQASLPTVIHALPHSLKVFWVLHPLASQFNAGISNNLVMFEPSALILVLSLVVVGNGDTLPITHYVLLSSIGDIKFVTYSVALFSFRAYVKMVFILSFQRYRPAPSKLFLLALHRPLCGIVVLVIPPIKFFAHLSLAPY